MEQHTATVTLDTAPPADGDQHDGPVAAVDLVEEELLVEEISIDGMCGVY